MFNSFTLNNFISMYVTKRPKSMFLGDVENNHDKLSRKIKDKRMLIIGGAGSIGSSFIREILPYRPRSLVVVDTNENALAELVRNLRSTYDIQIPDDFVLYPMDYSSSVFEKMFVSRDGFDVVANFSAHKHVRSEKDIFSVEALLQNNVLHTKRLLDLLSDYHIQSYFSVSTDKAANPVNIMGASKRIMEDVIFSYSDKFPVKTARFANVAFSQGSLPASFLARIWKLQPLCAPSDVKRYFVSPEEAGQICMLSCAIGGNREIFFPKLEKIQMMSFEEIATKLLEENGYEVLRCSSDEEAVKKAMALKFGSKQYPVRYCPSDTSGEKAFEEFHTASETVDLQRFVSLGVICDKPMPDRNRLDELLQQLTIAFECRDTSKQDIVDILEGYLPNFKHIEKGKSLDSKL